MYIYCCKSFVGANDLIKHIATHCTPLQHTATHCNTLQHTATLIRWGKHSHIYIHRRIAAHNPYGVATMSRLL